MLKKVFLSLLLASLQVNAVIDINGKGINKQSLFFGACKNGNAELIELLIKDGKIDINAKNSQGQTAILTLIQQLSYTDQTQNICTLRLLISAGANLNIKYHNSTPHFTPLAYLNYLIINHLTLNNEKSIFEIMNMLIKAGAKFNYEPAEIPNILLTLCNQNKIDLVKMLITEGIIIPKYISTEILNFCGSIEMIKLLIDLGVDINIVSEEDSATPLILATKFSKIENIKFLLAYSNVNTEAIDKDGKTAFDLACETGNEVIIELFQNYYREKSTQKSIVTIENNSENNLNILQSTTVPANSKAIITTEIFEL